MRGHFKKRNAKWYFWAELPAAPDGRRRQVSRGGFKTRREAEVAFAALRDDVRQGTHVAPHTGTLAVFMTDEWLPAIRASVRPSTWSHYELNVRTHIVPRLGAQRLHTMSPSTLNATYADL